MEENRESVFDILHESGLNRATLQKNTDDEFTFVLGKEWDEDHPWHLYNKHFHVDTILTQHGIYHDHEESINIVTHYGFLDYLDGVKRMMIQGGHERIEFFYYAKKNIRFINCIHSSKAGLLSSSRALLMGGIRRHPKSDAEIKVIEDGLNLSRAMTLKNIFADLACGGCKITVHADPVDLNDLDEVGFLAYCNDRCKNVAGPDMNYPVELADVVRKHFSNGFAGGKEGQLGPTGKPTAWGTYHAIRAAICSIDNGKSELNHFTVAIQGLGSVGFSLAEMLLEAGCRLVVTDINEECFLALKQNYPDSEIAFVSPESIYDVQADIFSPCATGGIITKDRIKNMKFKMIIGPANNQLKAISKVEEIELAHALADANILFLPDWLHNMGGVLTGYEEYQKGDDADLDSVFKKIERLAFSGIKNMLQEAKQQNRTPLEESYQVFETF